ncbi:MAG TPA: methylamine dehydrogenase accessory protein MauD [Woeseiaceae bacterium]|nr:methylamine dehydrogenase accessory protein MauD [Woeseiaceae bacterium]
MSIGFIVSSGLLWAIVIILSFLVFALARQVGILHERVAPAGALLPTSGPKVGEMTEAMNLNDLDGKKITIGGVDSSDLATLIMFISPTCPVCKSLVPIAKSLATHESHQMRLVFASDGDNHNQHLAYVSDLNIEGLPYIISQPLGLRYEVSKLPFAVLIGSDGTLKSKGLVNSREHLESLVEAMESGVATLQDYVQLNNTDSEQSIREKAS